MAFIDQKQKAILEPGIKVVLKKYGMNGTISVKNYSTLVINIKSGPLDIIGNHLENFTETMKRELERPTFLQVNHYHMKDRYSGKVLVFLTELVNAAMAGNHNNSDYITDYFDVGWYLYIYVGSWTKPYIVTGDKK
jgi:hypothetical protein